MRPKTGSSNFLKKIEERVFVDGGVTRRGLYTPARRPLWRNLSRRYMSTGPRWDDVAEAGARKPSNTWQADSALKSHCSCEKRQALTDILLFRSILFLHVHALV
ncbi:uncharacterized protein LOC144013927 [Festucalex cinctus]